MPQYTWLLQDRNGVERVPVTGLTNRRFSFPLNRPPEASAQIAVSNPYALQRLMRSGVCEMVIVRDGEELETVFQLASTAASGDQDTQRLELAWMGAMSYLQHGLVYAGTEYSGIAQSRIVWGLVDDFQTRTGAGLYALSDYGAPTGEPTKSVVFEEDADLLDSIISLSERNDGFDFAVDTGRNLRCYYPQRGSDKSGTLAFEYPTSITAFQLDYNTAPGEIVTDLRVSGGPGTATVTAESETARGAYGRREASIQYSDIISDVSALQEFADATIAERNRPQAIPSITLRDHDSVPWGSYWLGDTVTVRINAGDLVDVDQAFRIVQISVDLDDNDNETITLDLNET